MSRFRTEKRQKLKLKVFDFGAFYDFRAYDFRAILHMFFGAFQGISCIRISCKGLHKLGNRSQTRLDLDRTTEAGALRLLGRDRGILG